MGISNVTTDSVRERVDIEEVVNDYVQLKRKGQNLWACCPFHQEKSPSFSVSPSKQIYKCFGCGKAGDPIQFIMDIEGVGFAEAIRHLAQKYGIEIIEDQQQVSPEAVQAFNEKESLYIALNFAKDLFVKNLQSDEGKSIGLSYLKERGFTPSIIEKFDLGYSIDAWDSLLEAAKAAGYSEDALQKAGLILEREQQPGKFYDRFRGRVMFTIHNLGGKAIAFGARTLKKDKNQPKYINSPETAVYHKSDVLYGIFQAKKAIRQLDNCYLVEGYTDVVSMHLTGIENVVASSGTSLTENQIKLIKRFTDQVTILYDGDSAGIKASLRGIDMLLEGGLNVKAVVFPDGDDPDSYSQKVGADAFQRYLKEKAQDFISFKIGIIKEEGAFDPVSRASAVRQVVQSIAKIPDPILRTLYTKESSRLLDIEEELILAELNKIFLKDAARPRFTEKNNAEAAPFSEELLPSADSTPSKVISQQLLRQERETMRLLINYGFEKVSEEFRVCDYLIEETVDLKFETPVFKRIFDAYKQALLQGILPGADYFIKASDPEVKKEVIDMITHKYELSKLWEQRHQIFTSMEADDLAKTVYFGILRLKKKVVKKLIQELMEKMREANEQEIPDLQGVYMQLKSYQVDIDKQLGTVISN
ncbi:MAG: DNA primase [Alphaproteobacteria bacterium]|nr:DNA primase [Alphaproteobacteria bacterium]